MKKKGGRNDIYEPTPGPKVTNNDDPHRRPEKRALDPQVVVI